MKMIKTDYADFDWKGERQHGIIIKIPTIQIKQWIARKLGLINCKYFACIDHRDVICLTHQEIIGISFPLKNELVAFIRKQRIE